MPPRPTRRACLSLGLAASVAVLSAGCLLGPNYRRPPVPVPPAYRGAPPAPPAPPALSLGAARWWTLFRDPVLQRLIRTALAHNDNLRIAATRVTEAQAALGITRGAELPAVGASGSLFYQRNPKVNKVFPAYSARAGELNLNAIWNLDFWGKYRRQTEAARDQLLATQWGRRAVMASVVANVASAYFQLRALDLALSVARQTLADRQAALRLENVLHAHGSASLLDVAAAQELAAQAAEQIPVLQRQSEQQENAIRVLLGEDPGPIARGWSLDRQPALPAVPAGLPSELLNRRPDILEAEANLMAANADIGVAKAEFFPQISLTGVAGLESYALNRFFAGAARQSNAALPASQPIFEAGVLRNGLRFTLAQKRQLLLAYEQTIQQALQQVSDALIAVRRDRQVRIQQQKLTNAAARVERLAEIQYRNGGASYLAVLTNQTNYFAARLNLAQARLDERLALVQLYNALGGGWRQ
jgi:multidrug efflux system outer membrane protein